MLWALATLGIHPPHDWLSRFWQASAFSRQVSCLGP